MVNPTHTQMNKPSTLTHTPDGKYDYRGVVLSSREDNGYHDSYFYSTIWCLETNTVKEEMTGATAFAGGWYVHPNALPIVREVAAEFLRIKALEDAAQNVERDAIDWGTWKKGDTFTVVRGRKIPKGSTVTLLSVREPVMNPWSRTKEHTVLVTRKIDTYRYSTDIIKAQYLVMTDDCLRAKKIAAQMAVPSLDALKAFNALCERAREAVIAHRTAA